MAEQPDMFPTRLFSNRVTKYQPHSATSKAAAREIEYTAKTLRARVYRCILNHGNRGRTDEEIQLGLKMMRTPSSLRVELVEKGLVKDSGRRRKTTSKREAVVWVSVEEEVAPE